MILFNLHFLIFLQPVARVLFSKGTTVEPAGDRSTHFNSLSALEETDLSGVEPCQSLFESHDQLENAGEGEVALHLEQLDPNFASDTFKENADLIHAFAQSTPKPESMHLESFPLLATPVTRHQSLALPSKKHRMTNHQDVILQSEVSLEALLTPSTERALVRAAEDLSFVVAARSSCDGSDVGFGSPSQSFEQAMAQEADKVSLAVEGTTKTSGLGG